MASSPLKCREVLVLLDFIQFGKELNFRVNLASSILQDRFAGRRTKFMANDVMIFATYAFDLCSPSIGTVANERHQG
jgi:hypothetical protein